MANITADLHVVPLKGGDMRWEDVKDVMKWTLKHAKHLDPDEDPHLLEKEIDNCHLAMMQREAQQKDSTGPKCEECGKPMTQVFKCFRCPPLKFPGC
jgi:hypothetical protein